MSGPGVLDLFRWQAFAAALVLVVSGVATASERPATSRWVVQGSLVYDRKTDLTWQRCVHGQRWEAAAGCVGMPQRLSFDDALKLQAGGWRVPRLDELVSIVMRVGSAPLIDTEVFPGTPASYFWATDNRDLQASWYVSFEDGRTNHYYPPRSNRDLLRLVRSGSALRGVGKP